MTISAASRLRQHQRVTPLAARLAAMGLGDPAALCTVHAPLTGSLTLTKGAGSITHSRADTFAPTTTDHEGIVRVCRQGEVRFWGLRRVENLFAYSEAPASWATQSAVACTGQRIAASAASSAHYIAQTITTASGRTLAARFSLRAGGVRYAWASLDGASNYALFDLQAGAVVAATSGTASITADPDAAGYWLCSYRLAAAATSAVCALGPSGAAAPSMLGDGVAGIDMRNAQLEDVTSQSDPTCGEYVSTGVATAPSYHGANVDGVRYYATTQAGAAIAGGGLLVEGSAQNLLGNTDMTSGTGTWYGICSASNDGTYAAGVAMCKITKTTTSSYENRYAWANGELNLSAGWYACKLLLLASANCTQASVEIYGNTSGYGADANAVNAIISGPGTLTRLHGSLFNVTGLSTATPTVIECKRNLTVSEPLRLFFYPDLRSSTTSGKAIYAAVCNFEAGSICTSRIPTAGSMLTRPADSVTLPTAGNLGAEWGAMSATVTLPSVAATGTTRMICGFLAQSTYPAYVYDSPPGSYSVTNMWGDGSAAVLYAAPTPGTAIHVAGKWRSGDKSGNTINAATAGVSPSAATAAALPVNLVFGHAPAVGDNPLHGAIRDLKLYGLDLTAAQLQTVTT